MLLDISLGKKLINWQILLSKNSHHSPKLGSWALNWGAWLLFLSLRFYISISMVLHLVLIFLISLVLTKRLLMSREREGEKDQWWFCQSCDKFIRAAKYDLNLWLHRDHVFDWNICPIRYFVHSSPPKL